jgi:hydrogenase maturation protein HypF
MTSGNLSDEPICTDNEDALTRLGGIGDAFLLHNRRIAIPCDDSVVRLDGANVELVRRSRGYAPLPIQLSEGGPTILAVGAELKNTFCVAHGSRAFMSGHIGDMGSLESQEGFSRTVNHLVQLRGESPEAVAADSHTGYASRQWAEKFAEARSVPLISVQHHHAHVVSLLAEARLLGTPIVGVAFDGTGLGCDQHIWGGEFLVVDSDYANFERVASGLGPDDWKPQGVAADRVDAVWAQLRSGRGCVPTSSVGRLFDGVAALLGVRNYASYEGQAPSELESAARQARQAEPLNFSKPGDGALDWRPAVRRIVTRSAAGVPTEELAAGFHAALAAATAAAATAIARRYDIQLVGLTGGVFANRLLTQAVRSSAERAGLQVLTHRQVPCNDGGLSLGQAAVARALSNPGPRRSV